MASSSRPSEEPALSESSPQPEPADIYINITKAPGELLSVDAPKQCETLFYSDKQLEDVSELKKETERFSMSKVLTKSLANMQRIYEEKQARQCLELLLRRVQVDWRGSDMVQWPRDLGNIMHWTLNANNLDMLVAVSRGIGLGALLPNHNSDLDWQLELSLSLGETRNFGVAHAKLGFDPSERMLWVGKTPMLEDVWIAMVPNAFEKDSTPMLDELKDTGKRNRRHTQLRKRHRRTLLLFLAHVLSRIGMRHISVRSTYPDLDGDDEDFSMCSDIL